MAKRKTANRRDRESDIEDQLRTAINDSGKTQYRIAKDAGCKPEQIGRFTRRERTLTLTTAAKICRVLELELTTKAA